ncbi:MAG: ABC transporter permease [Acidobacteriota bacterium]|nr:ABC transporter permease [Acidobacteriota bacterium]
MAVGNNAVLLAVLVALVALFGLTAEHFFSTLTLRTVANQVPALLTVSVGMTLVLVAAGIDLSVGSVLSLAAAVLGVLVADGGVPVVLAALIAMTTGLACGLVNGWIVTRWRVPAFIVTLGMLEVARGGAYLVTDSQTRYLGPVVAGLARPTVFGGISTSFLLAVAFVAVGEIVLRRTVYGRHLTALGANEEAARLSGIDVRRVRLTVFAVAGLLAGIAGLFQTAYLESSDPNAGIGIELQAIAAVVIGGTSLMGGRGSVVGTFFGVLIIAILQTGLAQLGASEPSKRVITGLVIVLAVVADVAPRRLDRSRAD